MNLIHARLPPARRLLPPQPGGRCRQPGGHGPASLPSRSGVQVGGLAKEALAVDAFEMIALFCFCVFGILVCATVHVRVYSIFAIIYLHIQPYFDLISTLFRRYFDLVSTLFRP